VRLALVAREFYPFVGGGIAPIVAGAARQLDGAAEVTVVTSADHREEYERLARAGDHRLPPSGVRMVFVEEPDPADWGAYLSYVHAWSAKVYSALREAYPGAGPDLIEFCDYLGDGLVTVQARRTADSWLADTRVCVRLHTTSRITSILDGHLPDDFGTVAIHEAERYVLERADTILWSGGDVLATYQRLYGADSLAPAVRIRDAFLTEHDPGPDSSGVPGDRSPLCLLYVGRLERRKGVHNLIRAVTALERDDIRLTMLGGDTTSGPLGTSVRAQLDLMAAGDARVEFIDGVPRSEVGDLIRRHHVVVVPSLWECWPNVGREALMHNRPLLATPVGGLLEMARPGRSGWLTRDRSEEALHERIAELAGQPALVTELIEAGGPRAVFEELTEPGPLVDGYRELAADRPRRPSKVGRTPLVSIVIPYFRLDRHVEETLESVARQTYPAIEIVIVNDGSLRDIDGALFGLGERHGATVVTQPNSGLGSARNFGIAASTGEYLLPLDADDVLAPDFVELCVNALENDPKLAYVTSWVRYVDDDGRPVSDEDGGYTPFGNWSTLIERNNVGGTCSAVMRRSLFERGFRYSTDLTSYEDWLLYQELHDAGIPQRLIDYRVRVDSMMRTVGEPRLERLHGELRAHRYELETAWSPWEEHEPGGRRPA
jgi:glycogen synthase